MTPSNKIDICAMIGASIHLRDHPMPDERLQDIFEIVGDLRSLSGELRTQLSECNQEDLLSFYFHFLEIILANCESLSESSGNPVAKGKSSSRRCELDSKKVKEDRVNEKDKADLKLEIDFSPAHQPNKSGDYSPPPLTPFKR